MQKRNPLLLLLLADDDAPLVSSLRGARQRPNLLHPHISVIHAQPNKESSQSAHTPRHACCGSNNLETAQWSVPYEFQSALNAVRTAYYERRAIQNINAPCVNHEPARPGRKLAGMAPLLRESAWSSYNWQDKVWDAVIESNK